MQQKETAKYQSFISVSASNSFFLALQRKKAQAVVSLQFLFGIFLNCLFIY